MPRPEKKGEAAGEVGIEGTTIEVAAEVSYLLDAQPVASERLASYAAAVGRHCQESIGQYCQIADWLSDLTHRLRSKLTTAAIRLLSPRSSSSWHTSVRQSGYMIHSCFCVHHLIMTQCEFTNGAPMVHLDWVPYDNLVARYISRLGVTLPTHDIRSVWRHPGMVLFFAGNTNPE